MLPGLGQEVQPFMDPVDEAEEGQPPPGKPLAGVLGKEVRHHAQQNEGQAVDEKEVVCLSLKPATQRTLYSFCFSPGSGREISSSNQR